MGKSPRTVLQAGPPPESVGGMAQVATLLAESPVLADRGLRVEMVDSGGGRGRAGYWAYPAALVRALRGRYDLLHLHVASGGSVVRKAGLAAAAGMRRRPYVVHLHGGGFDDYLAGATPRQLARARQLFGRAARVVVLGDLWADVVAQSLGVDGSRIEVVPNGVEALVPQPRSERRREIVFVGGLTRAKGIDVLLDVLEARSGDARWNGWRIVLVGPEKDEAITSRLDDLERSRPGLVERTGPLFGVEKAERVASAEVFVLPSRVEGLPLVVLEAMSCGVATIATDVGSTAAVLTDRRDGMLVPAGDAEALGAALDAVVSDDQFRTCLAAEGHRTWRSRFSSAEMAEHMGWVWTGILAERP